LDELADSISSGVQIEEEYESKQLGKLISDYVWSLNEKQRYLFVDRYYLAEPVEKTASDLSVSTQSVYRELRKIKQGLKEYLERNGVHI
jgi:RNA polymerase sigma-70 factor (ECF subfamily)